MPSSGTRTFSRFLSQQFNYWWGRRDENNKVSKCDVVIALKIIIKASVFYCQIVAHSLAAEKDCCRDATRD